MKRYVHLILLSLAWIASSPPARAGLPGDVYPDCKVDIADAVLLERSLVGYVTLTDEQAANADLAPILSGGGTGTKDGVIDVADLVTLKRLVARDAAPATPLTPLPVITSPSAVGPTPTSVNPWTITGNAVANSTVTLYVNGRKYPNTVTATGGSFTFDNLRQVPLVDGENRITVVASTSTNQSCSSEVRKLDFSISPPLPHNPPPAITSNTVWTPGTFGGNPVTISSDFNIPSGKVLFIQPGVVVAYTPQTPRKYLTVQSGGSLQVLGTATQEVKFGLPTGVSCTDTNSWGGIYINSHLNPRNRIQHAVIDCAWNALTVGSSSPSASVEFRDSAVSRWRSLGIVLGWYTTSATIERNQMIVGPGSTALSLMSARPASGGAIDITDNHFKASSGAVVDLWDKPTTLKRNLIEGTAAHVDGISIHDFYPETWQVTGPFVIENNTITNNCNGIVKAHASERAKPTLFKNNIFDNDNCGSTSCNAANCKNFTAHNGITNFDTCALNAESNWWGSTDLAQVQATIHGQCSGAAGVDFVPYLNAPFDQGGVAVGGSNLVQGTLHNGNKPAAGTDWVLIGAVTIPSGSTLTITDAQEQRLKFSDDAELIVEGTLVVEDQTAADVVFTSYPPSGTPALNDWKGIVVRAGGSATIADAAIEYALNPVIATGSGTFLEVKGSAIRSFWSTGVRIENGASAYLHDNRNATHTLGIIGTAGGGTGVYVYNTNASVRIDSNEIRNFSRAVEINGSSPKVRDNLIKASSVGVHISGTGSPEITSKVDSPTLPGNEIRDNCSGIYVVAAGAQPQPVVRENKIHFNNTCGSNSWNYYIESNGSSTVLRHDAENNWWGTNDPDAISLKIHDREESDAFVTYPTVDFVPFYNTDAPGATLISSVGGATLLLGPVESNLGNPNDVLAPGNYRAAGTLVVDTGDVWRIGPGVTLELGPGYELTVDGSLRIAGTSGSPSTVKGLGTATWQGIIAEGNAPSGQPKVDVHFATIDKAIQGIDIKNTTSAVSITDSSILRSHMYAISLANVRDADPEAEAVIERNLIDDTNATGISVADSDVLIDHQNTIRDMGVGVKITGDSNVTIGTSVATGNTIENFSDAGILFSGAQAQGSIVGNTLSNNFADQEADGIELISSSPTISSNTISGTYFGIHVFAASNPVIDEGNVITDNVWGILLRGDRLPNPANPLHNPNPQIEHNSIFANACADNPCQSPIEWDLCPTTGGNICIYGFQYDADLVIDARENDWDTTVASQIRSRFFIEGSNPIPVDFSDFLDAGGQIVAGQHFSTVFSDVSTSPTPPIIRPTIDPNARITISFSLLDAATGVAVNIYEEKTGGVLVRTLPVSTSGAGAYSVEWDGRNGSGLLVADDAYRFEIDGLQGGYPHNYEVQKDGRIFASLLNGDYTPNGPDPDWNAHRNQYLKALMGNVYDWPMRGIVRLEADAEGNPIPGEPTLLKAIARGQKRLFVFDGRNQNGVIQTSASTGVNDLVRVGFHGLTSIRRDAIFVQDTAPSIFGSNYVSTPPSISNVEVLSDPYLVAPTYDQVSTIQFKLDQPAIVSVKVLKPNVPDGSNPANVVAQLQVQTDPQNPLLRSAIWPGYDVSNASASEVLDAAQSGSYTFLIEAQHPDQANLKTVYRGTIQVRLAPGM